MGGWVGVLLVPAPPPPPTPFPPTEREVCLESRYHQFPPSAGKGGGRRRGGGEERKWSFLRGGKKRKEKTEVRRLTFVFSPFFPFSSSSSFSLHSIFLPLLTVEHGLFPFPALNASPLPFPHPPSPFPPISSPFRSFLSSPHFPGIHTAPPHGRSGRLRSRKESIFPSPP